MPQSEKISRIPFTISIILPVVLWALLCAGFGELLILGQADFETTGTKTIFMISFPIYVLAISSFVFIKYGILRIIGIKKEAKHLKILNDNIQNGRLIKGLEKEIIKKIFYSLVQRPGDASRLPATYGILVVFFTLLTEWLASGMTINLPIIFISGLIALLLLVLFGTFFSGNYIYPTIKECRIALIEKGERVQEPQFISLKTKFRYFLLVPVLTILSILSFVSPVNFNIVIFSCLGLIMAAVITEVLTSSVYTAFLEIKDFAKELPKGKRVTFSTGALNKETIDLAKALNDAAHELHFSRESVKAAKKELKERVEELEKWYSLTVGRETKMVELKKEIKKLEEKLVKFKK